MPTYLSDGDGPGPVRWRWAFTALFFVFSVVVSSSFGYGLYLLVQVPRTMPPQEQRSAPEPPDVQALLGRAKGHLEKREVEQALVAYRRVLFAHPSLEAQLGLAEGERMAGRKDLAASEYERVLRLDARNLSAHLQLARVRSELRETWPQAEEHYREYLGLRPGDAEAQLGLARLLAWQGRGAQAVELYASAAVQPLLTPADRRDHALALVSAGRHAEAEPLLERLIDAAPEDADLALTLAGMRASRGDWDRALPLYRAVLARRPDDPRVNLAYGQGLLARRDHARALDPLGRASRGLPSNRDAALAYARAARGAGRLEQADELFARAVALDEHDAAATREYADVLMERRNYRKAESLYRRAHAAGLNDDGLLLALGGALAANNKPREAVPFLEQVYARHPSERLAFELARLYKKLGRNDRALALLAEIGR